MGACMQSDFLGRLKRRSWCVLEAHCSSGMAGRTVQASGTERQSAVADADPV